MAVAPVLSHLFIRSIRERSGHLKIGIPLSAEIHLPIPKANMCATSLQNAEIKRLIGSANGGGFTSIFLTVENTNANNTSSKHMDKHDRPYRCGHASCAKLQGFTYSGGLLRHEREVHGKHGGPKAQLMCPHEDCKRHAGKGFTRKENLNEHIRRVHSSNPPTQSQSIPLKREGADVIPGAEDVETPASRISEVDHDDRTSPTHKRRRYNLDASERSASEDVEDLKDQVRRLTSENAEKDSRIMDLDARLRDFEAAMRQLQQQGQGQG